MPEKENQEELNKLNIRQLKFIDGLLEGKNQTRAYINAGYDVKDETVAKVNASRLLTNANIQEELQRRLDDLKTRNRLRLYRISELALSKLVSILESDENIEIIEGKKVFTKDTYLIKIKADLIKDILDRVGLKLAEEYNVNLKSRPETDLPEEKQEEIIKLAYKAITNIPGENPNRTRVTK